MLVPPAARFLSTAEVLAIARFPVFLWVLSSHFMDFHVSSWVFMCLHGSSWVFMDFHGSSWVFMRLHGSSWVFMGPHGSSCVFLFFDFSDFCCPVPRF